MNKEMKMMNAQMLRENGWKVKQIAEYFGKSERTAYNYLSKPPSPPVSKKRKSKIDGFRDTIDTILQDSPNFNRELIFERVKNQGYKGGISTLRVYAAKKCEEIEKKAVIRFETEPAKQGQVDWKVFGTRLMNGKKQKLYAFVMVLGYSRMPFVCFTTSMNMNTFLLCHIQAFRYFGGLPREILYDNMKTAWICDSEGVFRPNKRLLCFAHHYGFIPKRCQIRRPQTKGKVERFIDYLSENFMPRYQLESMELEQLNTQVIAWKQMIADKILRDLQETRRERFQHEKPLLLAIPDEDFDLREMFRVDVNRESFILFETNRYSVPPQYIGRQLELLVHPVTGDAELRTNGVHVRHFQHEKDKKHHKQYLCNDRELIYAAWKQQNEKRTKNNILKKASVTVITRSPSFYDTLQGGL